MYVLFSVRIGVKSISARQEGSRRERHPCATSDDPTTEGPPRDPEALLGKLVAHNLGLLSLDFGLLWGIVASLPWTTWLSTLLRGRRVDHGQQESLERTGRPQRARADEDHEVPGAFAWGLGSVRGCQGWVIAGASTYLRVGRSVARAGIGLLGTG